MIGAIPQTAKPWLLGTVTSGILIILGLVGQYWLVSQLFLVDVQQAAGQLLLMATVLVALRFGLIIWHRHLGAQTSAQVKQRLRTQLLDKLAKLKPHQMTPDLRGKLNYLLGEGVEVLDLYWGLFVPQFFIGLLGSLLVCLFIACIDPFSGFVLLLMIPLIPAILMLVFKRFASVSATYKHNLAVLTELFTQSLHGLPVLKLYQFSKAWGREIEHHGESLRRSTMSLLKTNQLVILLVDLLFSLGTIVAASLLAITRYQSGIIDAASAAFIILASVELIRPLSLMGAFFFAGALGREVQADVQQVLAMEENDTHHLTPQNRHIMLDIQGLTFGYDQHRLLFQRVDLTVYKGELVVIQGPSGCGKSTLFKLIRGQLQPNSGIITHQSVGYLQQMPYVFDTSLEDNCRLAAPNASQGDIYNALNRCGLTEWLRYPEGLLRQTGEGGKHISGGQAARLGLSRAFLSNHSLFLIDEPTRQLDNQSEQHIIDALHQLKQQAGVLVISHSPRLIEQADRVIDVRDWQNAIKAKRTEAWV
ncbi:ABC transporter ATP-binding protein/permease [Vibrio hepatarius]|uniref:ABC transporter ATP-binding protein/permease n=1 Tax=Vibrio hepatarius TaxID=171383 RepID=UPI00142DC737|nr:ATP-binding cassette domain-containing protein [Vibrio hepatarius]NIY84632.1 ATP-binding cassette domain-containing protein [Vibrio hepatarius]